MTSKSSSDSGVAIAAMLASFHETRFPEVDALLPFDRIDRPSIDDSRSSSSRSTDDEGDGAVQLADDVDRSQSAADIVRRRAETTNKLMYIILYYSDGKTILSSCASLAAPPVGRKLRRQLLWQIRVHLCSAKRRVCSLPGAVQATAAKTHTQRHQNILKPVEKKNRVCNVELERVENVDFQQPDYAVCLDRASQWR